ncbi:hypothetical protein MNV49_007993 [Pseudohyphozyma bogoriensis]|nr:hypothetical protein MNV49_007993 [Pseudohyphozyma bogoriensis]
MSSLAISSIGAFGFPLRNPGTTSAQTMEAFMRFAPTIYALSNRYKAIVAFYAFRRGKSASTITISVRGGYNPPDCGLESAVANFEYMIEDTSLG